MYVTPGSQVVYWHSSRLITRTWARDRTISNGRVLNNIAASLMAKHVRPKQHDDDGGQEVCYCGGVAD